MTDVLFGPTGVPFEPIRAVTQFAEALRSQIITRAGFPTNFTGDADFDLQSAFPLVVPAGKVFLIRRFHGGLEQPANFDLQSFKLNKLQVTGINGALGVTFVRVAQARIERNMLYASMDEGVIVNNRAGGAIPAASLFLTLNFRVMDPLIDTIRISGNIVAHDVTSLYPG